MSVERPRVGIDAHHLAALEGNRSYTTALLRALARSGTSERFALTAYGPAGERDAATAAGLEPGEAKALAWGKPLPRGAARRTALSVPLATFRDRLDVWHASFVAPPLARARIVLAVHDALALSRPELFPRLFALRMRVLLPRSIARAARVIVPTEQVRADLEGLGLGRGKTIVAPIGVDERVFHSREEALDESSRRASGVGGAYVLAVGRADRRKRLDVLVRAFVRVAREGEALVIAGPIAERTARRFETASAGARGRVVVVRSPGERALAALYRGARALAFPSAGEGLGLPVVEAMACGTPVVASDLAVVREVAGSAALALVPDPFLEFQERTPELNGISRSHSGEESPFARALADALRAALDLTPTERARRAEAGLERARAFSLTAMATASERAWREAIGRP